MSAALYAFGIIVGASVLSFIATEFVFWAVYLDYSKGFLKNNACVRIKFKEFLHFYAVSPESFFAERNSCRFVYQKEYNEYYIIFSFLDYIRYRHWLNVIDRFKTKKEQLDIKNAFCKDMRETIFESNKDIEEEIKDCATKFKEIQKRGL